MKIGIYCTSNTIYPVPTDSLYANMTVAGTIADTLANMGHEVYFFAPLGTVTKANLISFDMLPYSDKSVYTKFPHPGSSYEYENIMLSKAINFSIENNLDVLHSHMRPFSILSHAAHTSDVPIVITVHDPVVDDAYKILTLYNEFRNVHLVSLSKAQQYPVQGVDWEDNVYNGIDTDFWTPIDHPNKDYLLSVGRVMPSKGTDIAVQVAIAADLPLKIAGDYYDGDADYFEELIQPHLSDKIEYLGTKTPVELLPLYQNALAFLMPIRWEEPFGLVMTEALSCGTPVIATRHGSVPEVVSENLSGYIVDSEDDVQKFAQMTNKIHEISRNDCRQYAVDKFSNQRMAKSYLDLYERIVGRQN